VEKTNKNIVPIAFVTDENYALPTAVAIQSLIDSNDEELLIYVIANDVSKGCLDRFEKFNSDKVNINVVSISENKKKYDEENYYVSSNALTKFCIPRLIKDYDKVLYIDGDVLIGPCIDDLFSISVNDVYAAVVADLTAILAKDSCNRLGLKNYFNSGMILFNCKKYREDNMEEWLFEIKENHPEYFWMDQDCFNIAFDNKVKFINPRFNCMYKNMIFENTGIELAQVNEAYETNYKKLEDMIDGAVVYHLASFDKPWKYKNSFMHKEWMNYFEKSPFSDIQLKLETLDLSGARKWFGGKKAHTMPERII